MFGVVEVVLWVPKPGWTKFFGTQKCVAYGCCDWFWVPKDNLSWLFSTQISVGALITVDIWVLKTIGESGLWHPCDDTLYKDI
jgi:hypothetical protein